MTPDDRALVDRFLDMMAAEAGSSRHTIAAYRNDLYRTAEVVGSLGSAGAVNVIYGAGVGLRATGNQLWHQNSTNVADAMCDTATGSDARVTH